MPDMPEIELPEVRQVVISLHGPENSFKERIANGTIRDAIDIRMLDHEGHDVTIKPESFDQALAMIMASTSLILVATSIYMDNKE